MKVLQVLGGGEWGGGCVVVQAYISEMVRRGDEVWLLCLDDEVERRFEACGVKTIRSPFWFHPINPFDLVPFLQLWHVCRRETFDLVATHTSKGGFVGRLAAKAAGAPHIVHHAHGFAFRETQPRLVQRCYIQLERIAARACDLIISVSEDHRQAGLKERVAPAEKVVTVLNGIQASAFGKVSKEEARRTLGIETDDILIGVIGRLAPKKGVGDLIAAFTEIHKTHAHTRLVVLGDGPYRPELERLAAETGLKERIHFTGFRQNVPDLLSAFDVIAQPSISEGLSISLLEAMAAGKPVVACDIPGNREIITPGVNGVFVPPSDPRALAEGIRSVLDSPAFAQQLATAARVDCANRFSQDRMVSQIISVYDHIVAGKPVFAPQNGGALPNHPAEEMWNS